MLWPVRGAVQAVALGVNSHGCAVGYSLKDNKLVATLWRGDKGQVLDQGAVATAINDSGLIVGLGEGYPMVWREGRAQRLPGGRGMALALSPGGVIGGTQETHPVIWRSNVPHPDPLPVPDRLSGQVLGVNDRGQAVGFLYNNEEAWPAYWENYKFRDPKTLIPPGSNFTELFPRSVNNRGQVVGVGITKTGGVRGFVYTP